MNHELFKPLSSHTNAYTRLHTDVDRHYTRWTDLECYGEGILILPKLNWRETKEKKRGGKKKDAGFLHPAFSIKAVINTKCQLLI